MIKYQDASSICKQYYIDYAIYVYQTRALPSLIDGMKHVQRRTLVQGSRLPQNKSSKSSKLVGDTVPYHPHDPSSIYGAAVSMATNNNKFRQFKGIGNFGGFGYGPAAMRYTELYLEDYARYGYTQFLDYANVEVGESGLNEPTNLPALIPYSSVAGSSGIGVGMSTSILPLNFMDLIDYYIDTIKGVEEPRIPKPDFGGGLVLDMPNDEIKHNVQIPKSRFTIKSIITQESSSTLVLTALNNRTVQSILNKLGRKYLDTYKVDFRDESSKSLRLVFEIVDNSVPIVELRKALERATTGHNSFDRLLVDEEGKAVHSSLYYQTHKSLAYLNKVLDVKFKSELVSLKDREQVLLAVEYIKTSNLLKELPSLTVNEYTDKVRKGGFSLKHAKLATQKPTTYLTKSHNDELESVRKEVDRIESLDRTEYLLKLYTQYKKLLKPLYESNPHTVLRSELLANPKVKLKNHTDLVISSRGKPFNSQLLMVTDDGYLYPHSIGASIRTTVHVPDELNDSVVDIITDHSPYAILLTNQEGLLIVKYDSIKYAKQVIKLDKGEKVVKSLPVNANGTFTMDGIEYDPVPFVRTKVSKPHRNWKL